MTSVTRLDWMPWQLLQPATKGKCTSRASGLEDVLFTWGTVSDAVKHADVIDKLKETVTVHFQDQVTVATRVVKEPKALILQI